MQLTREQLSYPQFLCQVLCQTECSRRDEARSTVWHHVGTGVARPSRRDLATTFLSLTRSAPISESNCDSAPHSRGFRAAPAMKLAGRVAWSRARPIVTTLSSSGWRRTSRTRLPNSSNSSRNGTPRWASEVSPGRYQLAPPTRPAFDSVLTLLISQMGSDFWSPSRSYLPQRETPSLAKHK
jgi:hypothetical protein